jgi:hypothetical protein
MSASASESPSSTASNGTLWDVQEILAMRTSITGENEFLVVWKTTWIPVSSMHFDGPVISRFRNSPKFRFYAHKNHGMQVVLPIEPGTTLQTDCGKVAAELEQRLAAAATATPHSAHDRTPRKALNSVAKRKKTGK